STIPDFRPAASAQLPPADNEGWTTIISPHRGWLDWRLKQLWRYRDLISLFVWRDFVSVYKQTILGPLWHIIQPLLTTITFTIIFGKIAKLPTNGIPPFLFYLAGTVSWTYFANNITKTSATFVGNSALLGKVYFHRLAIPVSIAISNLISFGIQFGIFIGFLAMFYFKGAPVHLTGWAFCTPLFLLMLAGYGLGGGIIVSALTTRYRDLTQLVAFGVQLMMYATPVILPLSAMPAKWRWVLQFNPLTPIVEGFRLGFLGAGDVTAMQLGISFGVMIAVLAVGLMLFTHVERTFMDTV
ncbi:MAG TPA: ABC transporter permease, partial [Candidatus Paceibacterota bacterium]|nr:ABC transporter permease [Candidatus Paceibacterota bacterium]